MKKIILLILMQVCVFYGFAQKDFTATFHHTKNGVYDIDFDIINFKTTTVHHDGVDYQKIFFSQNTVTERKGWAELPFVSASIQLPAQKNVDLKIISASYRDIVLENPLLPSRGVIYRDQNPNNIPYAIADSSMVDTFYPENIAFSETPFVLRDVRGISVRVFPFQWNAVTKTLRVYTKIAVALVENDQPAINPLIKENVKPIAEAIGLYKSVFLNFNEKKYDLQTAEYGDILVITTSRDEAAIEPYIAWKREKGYRVAKEVVAKGTMVKELIQQKYNDNNNLMYVLLIGDWEDIQSEGLTFEGSRSPNDPVLGCVAGEDNFADIAIGRLSANNSDQVRIQVEKIIRYEKNPNSDSKWRETFIGIGSNQGTTMGDDNEIDSIHIQRIYDERLAGFTYQTHKRHYGHGIPVDALAKDINSGASTIAYCGHGSETSWFTTGYKNSDIINSMNGDNIPFIVSTACLNGAFHKSVDCFGETWLRKENGGALITWMSSINQPWSPPQRGQDYFYDLLIGGFDYDLYPGQQGINTHEQRTHWGSITVNAMALMLTESAAAGDLSTVKTWITFGDPSVQLRTKQPVAITSSWNSLLQDADYQTTITANGIPVKNALVALSQNGVYEHGLTDENGQITITHTFEVGEVLLVVTAFNTTTIYKTIPCIAPGSPYITCENIVSHDDNGQLDYSDGDVKLNFTARNVGTVDIKNLKITMSTNDSYVSIIDNEVSCASITAGETVVLNDAFEIKISENVPDEHPVTFNYSVTGSGTWNGTFTMTAHAAVLEKYTVIIDDNLIGNHNGQLDSGETAIIKIPLINNGSSEAINVKGNIFSEDPYLTIKTTEQQYFGDISAEGGVATLDFLVTAADNVPLGYDMTLTLSFIADYGIKGEFPVFIHFAEDYCKPTANCKSYGDGINSFSLNTIQNINNACSENGYGNFTAMSTTLAPGNNYDATIEVKSNVQHISLWIDFNDNHLFESSEILISDHKIASAGSVTLPISIPASAMNGQYRLRVKSVYNKSSIDPCANAEYGETEDYTVIIDNGLRLPNPTSLEAEYTENQITLNWKAPETALSCSYMIFRNNLYIGTATETNFIDSDIMNGKAHIYIVKAVYQEGVSEKFAGPAVVMVPIYDIPRNIRIDKNEQDVVVLWTAITHAGLEGYDIYRNNTKLNETLVTDNQWNDQIMDNGSYCYQIVAVYRNGFEAKSEPECIQNVSIPESFEKNRVKIFPNPASDVVHVICDIAPKQIRLFNMQGKMIYVSNSHEKALTIPVSDLPQGVYIIVFEIAENVVSKKIIVQ